MYKLLAGGFKSVLDYTIPEGTSEEEIQRITRKLRKQAGDKGVTIRLHFQGKDCKPRCAACEAGLSVREL